MRRIRNVVRFPGRSLLLALALLGGLPATRPAA
jgi:hypothetical protein